MSDSHQIVDMLAGIQGRSITPERYQRLLAAEASLAAVSDRATALEIALAECREALQNTTRELQGWHDERPDPPGPLRDYCVSCGYLDDARAILATDQASHGAEILGAARAAVTVYEAFEAGQSDAEHVFSGVRDLALALTGAGDR